MIRNKAFTILELLVVLAVIGVFSVVAYPKISNWIDDRNVKKEVFETVTFFASTIFASGFFVFDSSINFKALLLKVVSIK